MASFSTRSSNMSTPRKRLALRIALLGGFLGLFGAVSLPLTRSAGAGKGPAAPKAVAGEKDTRQADRAQLQAQMKGFLKAFESGDADKVASYWTQSGELIGEDGYTYRGRAAVAKAYRESFAKKGKRVAEVQQDSLRFPSQDTAIAEGHFRVRLDKEAPTSSRYSVLHVREGGKWLMAVVREWPGEAATLHDLEWLIGTWVAKREDAEVETTYKWMWKKSFIRMDFTIRHTDHTLSGFQMIGKDPASGQLHSWTFESEGGVGDAAWTRDGKKWVLDSSAQMTDGSTLTVTNILTPLGPDAFTWQAVKRTLNGEELDDLAPVKVTRVKQK
jgi:uncharacterized protein (TIGR02246 family)